ncbi:MAG: ribonuclease H-like domain-containing protein [Planctomycetes bacterium]|nr:ribonuclease H-like domain-containing protein [Planctomycetota bacterium]
MAGDLRKKLQRALGDRGPSAGEPAVPPVRPGAGLRAYLARRAERAAGKPAPIVELPPGEECSNERGACFVIKERIPLARRHGSVPLDAVRRADWSTLARWGRDESFAAAGVDECLFVDTETTGLAAAAGTTVFLTGMAFLDGAELVLEQVFLRRFDEEPGALGHVLARIAERPLLVSYVGKSFDRHRLASRMVLHGIDAAPVLQPRHLDLYHCARRAWGEELPDCRLRTIEQRRLALHRRDDLPGSEAPRAWLDWLRDGTGPVDRVLAHNRDDVLSLVALLGLLGRS